MINDEPGEEAVTKALAPYHEFECTGTDDEFVKDVDLTEELRKSYETETVKMLRGPDGTLVSYYDDQFYRAAIAAPGSMDSIFGSNRVHFTPDGWTEVELPTSEVKTFGEHVEDEYAYKVANVRNGKAERTKDHTYGYVLLNKDGTVSKVIQRTNESKHWDWYQIGGRWTGFFKVRSGLVVAKGRNKLVGGKPGLMTDAAKPGYADQLFKSDIDIEGMRDEAVAKAEAQYNLYHSIADKHLPIVDWETMRENYPGNIDGARKEYHAQPGIVALRQNKDTAWLEPSDFTLNLEGHCLRARNGAMRTFAVVKDGKWYERGEMGWWGCVHDEKPAEEWSSQFAQLIDGLPDNAVLTCVDCHI